MPTRRKDEVPFQLRHFDALPDSAAISIAIATQIAGVSRATLYRAIADGRLQQVKLGGRSPVSVGSFRLLMRGGA